MGEKKAISVLQADFDLTDNNGFESGMLAPWIGFNAKVVDAPSFSGLYCAKLAANGLNAYIYQRVFIPPVNIKLFFGSITKADQRPNPPISIVVYQNIPSFEGAPGFTHLLFSQIIPFDSLTFGVWTSVNGSLQPPFSTPGGLPPAYVVINAIPTVGTSPVFIDDVGIGLIGPG